MSALAAAAPETRFAAGLHALRANRAAMLSLLVVAGFAALALLAPWIAPHDPADGDLLRRLQPPAWMEGGEAAYPLGCDALGRDILSRLIHGTRVSMSIGVAVVLAATAIGALLGLLAGYLRGGFDVAISRVVDVLLGFPYLIFAIGLMAVMGPGLANIVLVLVIKEWVMPCRVVRAETLAAREMDYVEAARALGETTAHILFREILPNILSTLLVVATFRMAAIIIIEASLSFLGLGVQPPTPTWGNMLRDAVGFLDHSPWMAWFPGIAIFTTVLGFNLLGDGLRDRLDPRAARGA